MSRTTRMHLVPALALAALREGVPLDDAVATLGRAGIEIICGPVDRFGGREGGMGRSVSVYVRDPDLNLVEISEPAS